MNILVIDTETTGLPPRGVLDITNSNKWECCRIVQFAWAKYTNTGTLISKECYTIYPDGYSIPDIAANIHGITTEKARNEGIDIIEVFNKLNNNLKDVDKIVAHNIKFDDSVIQSEIYRYKQNDLYIRWCNIKKECTMMMSSVPGKKWLKLNELYKQCFNKEPEQVLHRADSDVEICANIYFYLQK
mgnify:CR=1 FL=1